MDKIQEMYYADLKKIPKMTDDEFKSLKPQAEKGDKSAKKRITEGYLYLVRAICDATEIEGPEYMDYVQEGNLALAEYVANCKEFPENAEETLKIEIGKAVLRAMETDKAEKTGAATVAAKLNIIDDITKKYSEDHDAAPTAEEISKILNIPVEEVKYLLNMALSALTKEEDQ